MGEEFKRSRVSDELGLPPRTVQLYTDMGLIIPEIRNPFGKGFPKIYSAHNIYQFSVIIALKQAGLTLKTIKGYMDKYRHDHEELSRATKEIIKQMRHIESIEI